MTLAHEVASALNQANINGLLKAYSYQRLRNPDSTHAVITVYEVTENPTEHGSNDYQELNQRIQLKFLFSNPTQLDADTFEKSIVSFLFGQKPAWIRQADNGNYIDATDTKPFLARDMYFERTK